MAGAAGLISYAIAVLIPSLVSRTLPVSSSHLQLMLIQPSDPYSYSSQRYVSPLPRPLDFNSVYYWYISCTALHGTSLVYPGSGRIRRAYWAWIQESI